MRTGTAKDEHTLVIARALAVFVGVMAVSAALTWLGALVDLPHLELLFMWSFGLAAMAATLVLLRDRRRREPRA